MTTKTRRAYALAVAAALAIPLAAVRAQDVKVDLSKETVGKTPVVFEPMMGMWFVAQDGPDKVIKVDGAAYKAALSTPARLALENARKMYGTSNEELMDNAKQFTVFPIAVLKTVDNFTNGTISVKFKTIAGDADRASGILFNVKPNGDWLVVRYNDTEHNLVMWEFHNGIRRPLNHKGDGQLLSAPGDREKWHDLKIQVEGAVVTAFLDGTQQWTYQLDGAPGPQRRGAPPNPDLFAANNPVLQPPVKGRIGLWTKTDSTSEFKDYVVTHGK
ncbi:MAG TPA: family 16 glycoside hydrolase [Vicinamibacterales bacterium]|nr:family 16 glycoside hydrolase [Vicinamibacterales bacterium]